MSEGQQSWAQLVSTTDTDSEPISIRKDKFTIGRSKDCDQCIAGNMLLSSVHCFIERDPTTPVTYLQDTSTNGTLLNMKSKVHRQRVILSHGDEIHLVYRTEDSSNDVAFLFQDLEELRKEQELESTLEDSNVEDVKDPQEIRNCVERHGIKRSSDALELDDEESRVKKPKSLTCTLSSRKEIATNLPEASPIPATSSKPAAASAVVSNEMCKMEESLLCIICQEIFHDCVSAQPCMHSFCASCYSDWMDLSKECPSCRTEIVRIARNHMVNNLVEAYLTVNPDKRRPPEDIQAMDAKNKITQEMLNLPAERILALPEPDDDDDEDDDDDDDGDDDDVADEENDYNENVNEYRPPKAFCRQCPEYEATLKASRWQPELFGSGASKDGAGCSSTVVAPVFVCDKLQTHILCRCCLEPMPHRQGEIDRGALIPTQKCSACLQPYCHLYWGCLRSGCHGCLFNSFEDVKLGREVFTGLVLDNQFESEVLKNYLDGVGKTVDDLVKECLERVTSGRYTSSSWALLIQRQVVCYRCSRGILSELAYQYMLDIPRDQLPVHVTSRPLCHWGKNCRTQKNKPLHAASFSHLGEQIRWA